MRVTKYDEDDFSIRVNRNDAVRLLALLAACASEERMEKADIKKPEQVVLFNEDARVELFRVLELEGDEDDLDYYPRAKAMGDGLVVNKLQMHPVLAERFLQQPEAA